MTKKEQARLAELEEALRIAKAFRFTEKVLPDVPPPNGYSGLTKGFAFIEGRAFGWCGVQRDAVEVACSSSTSHAVGQDDKTTSQWPKSLYSTRKLALRALRHEIELRCAKMLADIDAMIEEQP